MKAAVLITMLQIFSLSYRKFYWYTLLFVFAQHMERMINRLFKNTSVADRSDRRDYID